MIDFGYYSVYNHIKFGFISDMHLRINEPVSVELDYNHQSCKAEPKTLIWSGKKHPITQVGYHHTQNKGHVLFHIFSVVSHSNYFKLVLNTENLQWHLEEVASGF